MASAFYPSRPHRRWHALKGQWVLVSPHRTDRPWSGAVEKVPRESRPEYDPGCYLCPRNERKGGARNPDYRDVFVFDNDFPALYPDPTVGDAASSPDFIRATPEEGRCRVVCFSPRHDLTLPEMETSAVSRVIDTWALEYQALMEHPETAHVMIFENKGEMMGCSNPHPHGQIWASKFIPNIPLASLHSQQEHFKAHGSELLREYLDWELLEKERLVCRNEHWSAVVPFWAEWPFETMILPGRPVRTIGELDKGEREAWAALMRELLIRYDNLFETSFPYSMGVYQAPKGCVAKPGFCLHQVFIPPLLRSASIRKFMVGFELTAETQRDITAETAAGRLRECSTTHYKHS